MSEDELKEVVSALCVLTRAAHDEVWGERNIALVGHARNVIEGQADTASEAYYAKCAEARRKVFGY